VLSKCIFINDCSLLFTYSIIINLSASINVTKDENKNEEYFTNNPFNGFTFSKIHISQLTFIIEKKIPKYTEYYVFTKIAKKLPKDCPDGKVRNPATGRCILIKNAAKAVKAKKSPKDCPDGKVRNPATGRCILIKNAAKAVKASKTRST
jgi:hypothetical protein